MKTEPLAKAITTLEGQLVTATNVVLGGGAVIDPKTLPPKVAAIVGGALTLALLVQRLVLKAQASKAQAQVLGLLGGGNVDLAHVVGLLEQLAGEPAGAELTGIPLATAVTPDGEKPVGSQSGPAKSRSSRRPPAAKSEKVAAAQAAAKEV